MSEPSDETKKLVAEFLTKMVALQTKEATVCPVCGAEVESLRQTGRCVYSQPCNCRLYQGRVPEAWQ